MHECAWGRHLLIEMGQLPADTRAPFWCDIHGTIAIGNDEVGLTARNKWMDIEYFHFRDFQREGQISIGYVDTNLNPADYFTKKLEKTKSNFYIDIISGSASTIPGSQSSLPAALKKHLFTPYQRADHVPDRVHHSPQDVS